MTERKPMTTNQVADELGITVRRVRQLFEEGILAGEKMGRDLFIDPQSVDLAKERKTAPGPKSRAPTSEEAAAGQAAPEKPKRRASKRAPTKKGMKKTVKKGARAK